MTEPSPDHHQAPLESLRRAVLEVAEELAPGASAKGGRASITLERPRRAQFGDYSTNAALLLAPALGVPPRELAERLGRALQARLGASVERFEVAGPGFVNLFVSDRWLRAALARALAAGQSLGVQAVERPERILVEFVSANPTGPMHVGHARNAAYGDALARMLALQGHEVEREFYVNDAGSQVRKLGESIGVGERLADRSGRAGQGGGGEDGRGHADFAARLQCRCLRSLAV
jgi:arginyl-tRNA synthetase